MKSSSNLGNSRGRTVSRRLESGSSESERSKAAFSAVAIAIRAAITVEDRSQGRMPFVEQHKVKRSGVGLRACDRDRAFEGFTLFAPLGGNGTVYLIDLDGKVVHTWQMPYPPGMYGYLTDSGTFFYNGKTVDNSTRYINGKPGKGGAALEADWNGRVLWEVRHPDHHHDGIRLRNGNVLLICLAQLRDYLVAQVKGGLPGTEHDGKMYADYLVEMTTDGQVVWDWSTWEHLDPVTDRIAAVQDQREAWTHANGLAELTNGDIVVSFRNISTVIIIDRRSSGSLVRLRCPASMRQHRSLMATCCYSTMARTAWT